eukprot:TRINITY_DN13783_c0_g1_i1.p1 TRINITY_DN13783_c0_g1~~TRINITY_DN13783_c0_g1_i1.p1  ORF type:complete len:564 (+),score=84.40 TRINITY_DN13783_c0_g1_i1:179-1870(+)
MAAAFRLRTRSNAAGSATKRQRESGGQSLERRRADGDRDTGSRAAMSRKRPRSVDDIEGSRPAAGSRLPRHGSLWRGASRLSLERPRRSQRSRRSAQTDVRRSPSPAAMSAGRKELRLQPRRSEDGEPPRRRRRLRSSSRRGVRLVDRERSPAPLAPSADRRERGRSSSRGRGTSPQTRSGSPEPPADDRRPRCLLLMGLPGAGKTTVKRKLRRLRDRRDVEDIEPDSIKRRHPRYSEDMDDRTDEEVHRWSVRRAVDAFDNAVSSRQRPFVVFDSSGSNVEWMRHRVDYARQNGYRVELLWVDVPMEIALLRNRDRAARTGREMVPDKVIMDKAKVLSESFEKLRREVDFAERRLNWDEKSDELQVAKKDLYFYPPPRARPPGARPGEKGYARAPDGARSPSPSRGSRRKVVIGPWKRGDEVMSEKNKRLEWMDRVYGGDRERFVYQEVLCGRETMLEPNRYPYQLPPDLEHWIIWSRKDMKHDDLCDYIERWLDAREPHNVMSWNYDDNRGRRTIDIWHVHIYFQGHNGEGPWIRRRAGPDSKFSRPAQSASRRRLSPCSV